MRILQGYGQTEAAPVIAVNRPGHNRIETVGPAMLGVELRIAGDGEILVRGELVMRGYWRDSAATAQAIDADGWLHTGDIGEIDPDGCLRITDRKKDIIVNSGGDNVAPQRIEGFLTLEPEIAQAMVHGDRRPHLVALIVPDRDWVQSWAEANGQSDSLTNIMNGAELRKALSLAIDRVNRQLSPIEKIRRFMVITAPFDIENGMLTPTLKIRRHQIRAIYGSALDGLYEEKSQGRDQAFQ
ncbi:AMP-binding protein [Magnetospirillum sp. ME-1]|uniref:AMP-binding protein n=1 Tax=Magnetospirillum sp. ME-1 TaxID=1639348 RepID=UPI003FA60FE4